MSRRKGMLAAAVMVAAIAVAAGATALWMGLALPAQIRAGATDIGGAVYARRQYGRTSHRSRTEGQADGDQLRLYFLSRGLSHHAHRPSTMDACTRARRRYIELSVCDRGSRARHTKGDARLCVGFRRAHPRFYRNTGSGRQGLRANTTFTTSGLRVRMVPMRNCSCSREFSISEIFWRRLGSRRPRPVRYF
jgi:hypothetical protein